MPGNVPLLPSVPFPATIPVPADPVLKFSLLSEVIIRQDGHEGLPVADISQLAARADHFYISSSSFVRDYKILFGGNRSYQNSSVLMEKANFSYNVTCLHCSGQQPSLLVVGTELGNVFIWDLKKGYHGVVTPVHIAEVRCSTVCSAAQRSAVYGHSLCIMRKPVYMQFCCFSPPPST